MGKRQSEKDETSEVMRGGINETNERPIKDDAPVAWWLERTSQRPPNEPSGPPKRAAEVVHGVVHASLMCIAATL